MEYLRTFSLHLLELVINRGMLLGLIFAVIILLRPVTNRLLRPKYRVAFWMACWVTGWMSTFYELAGAIQLLPVTFRGWITPRLEGGSNLPGYFPRLEGAGTYTFALPGGGEIPFAVSEGTLNILALLVGVGYAVLLWWCIRKENRFIRCSQQGEPMSPEWHEAHAVPNGVTVRVMSDLPASFVCRGRGRVYNICLQKELPPGKMELVLKHELAHIRGDHVWYKSLVMGMMLLYGWNPIIWAAYRLTSRDIELACDEAVLKTLDREERREYARTLVELASGKHLWGGLTCFGECDAEIRVRRTVDWKWERAWEKNLVWPALILAFLFLFTSPRGINERLGESWEALIASDVPVQTLREHMRDHTVELEEIWVRDQTLMVLTDDDQWWFSRFSRSKDGTFYSNGWNRLEEPGKYEFVQVK